MIGVSIDPYAIAKDAAKFIRDKIKDDPELREKVMELNEALLDLHSQNLELRRELEEFQIRKQMRFDLETETYWQGDDGPFCQKCFDKEQSVIRLRTVDETCWVCTSCSSDYFKPGGREIRAEREEERSRKRKERNEMIRRRSPYR
jgi:hypothetical protein